jgi:hypothetical protein
MGASVLTLLPFLLIIPLGFLALFGGLVLFTMGPIRRGDRMAQASASWPTVTGTILVSELRPARGIFSAITRRTAPYVEYEYVVGPTRYRSAILSLGELPGPAPDPARYPVGAEVQVHYNPENPVMSVLLPGGSVMREFAREFLLPLGILVGAVIVVAAGLAILVLFT